MSRLIRDSKIKSKSPGPQDEPAPKLDKETCIAHIKECQAIAVNHAQEALNRYLEDLDEAFHLEIDQAKSNQEVSEVTGIQRLFRRNRAEITRSYLGYVSEAFVKFGKNELFTDLGQSNVGGELSLVNNDDLEETITISTITQKMDVFFAEPLWALNQRFAALRNGEAVIEASNPAAPVQLCESLRRALRLIPLTNRTKQVAYRTYEQLLTALARAVIEDCNDYLKRSGVLPRLRYVPPARKKVENPEGPLRTGNAGAAPMPSAGESPEVYQSALMQAIRNLQNNLAVESTAATAGTVFSLASRGLITSGLARSPSQAPPAGGGVYISADQMLAALSTLQADAKTTVQKVAGAQELMSPVDIRLLINSLGQQLQQTRSSADEQVKDADMHTIDLVGMLFEYMLNDENLPASVKALLSYLHTPFLKLAFLDPGFFEQSDHPARQLLNSLAEAGTRWIGNDGTDQHDMYNKIKAVTHRVLREFKNDVGVISELLQEFNGFTQNIVRRQELMEKRAAERAQGEERLREVKVYVNDQVQARINGRELPSAVLLFVLQPWSDFLSFTMLRYGEKSSRWEQAIAVVDDVLWVLEPRQSEVDLVRQSALAVSLPESMQAGFESIGYDQTKGKKLIDAISGLIEMAQQHQKAEPAPAPMRDQLEKSAAEKAGQVNREATTDLSQQESTIVENLKMIEFGTWFEFEGGKRLKVAWYNARTSHYMLVDQVGKRVAMMSGLEIAKEMIAKRAKIIAGSSKPFFERALENIFQKLNAQAEAQSGGPTHNDHE